MWVVGERRERAMTSSAAVPAPGKGARIISAADVARALSVVREQAGERANTAQMARGLGRAGQLDELRPEPELPVAGQLRDLLPWAGLRRGAVVAVHSSALALLALLGEASKNGAWISFVGFPQLSIAAADEAGIVLERVILVPHPGAKWAEVMGIMIDGTQIVVAPTPAGGIADTQARTLAARARQRGAVIVPFGPGWPGADLMIERATARWHGLGMGHGRLRWMEADYVARGRGSAMRPRRCTISLPLGAQDRWERWSGRTPAPRATTGRTLRAVPSLPGDGDTVAM
ncbi:hypothetical protein HDA40_002165 [Hamadaea flava]|uniref:Uncharacterized protein n=1 Tax=Hamadaea flava TaxID=1742688 RepID=A0ABV8LJR4_9ACTN|nr:hypothetical protein [Hamadaea flava]MCP2323658.1 hypothetical protein [Hamadaea flava]